MESKLKKILSDLDIEYEKGEGLLERISNIIENSPETTSPAPKSVPKALGLTPNEFMTVPLDRFAAICEASDFRRVSSSLNYIATFSGKDIPAVEKRVAEIRAFLKEWRAGNNPDHGSSLPPTP